MFRRGGLFRPRVKFSLDNLRYMADTLEQHASSPVETPLREDAVVETLRALAELLIWGDQNEPSFFLEFGERGSSGSFSSYLGQKHSGDCGGRRLTLLVTARVGGGSNCTTVLCGSCATRGCLYCVGCVA